MRPDQLARPGASKSIFLAGALALAMVAAAVAWQIAAAPAARASQRDATLEVVFKGRGRATNTSTGIQAEALKKASVSMSWTLRWKFPPGGQETLLLKPGDIAGSASETFWPGTGKGCSGKLTTNTTLGANEYVTTIQGQSAVPVPLVLGLEAETCYTRPGGGTGWYGILGLGSPALQAKAAREVYALLPPAFANGVIPRAGHYVRSGDWNHTYPVPGGGSFTIELHWTGTVDVVANGEQPPGAPTTTSSTPPPGPPSQPGKTPADVCREARLKLISELRRSNPFCFTAVVGNSWVVQGTAGNDRVLRAIVGDELVDASQRACAAQVRLIGDLMETYDDPPRSDVDVIAVPTRARTVRATLGACSAYSGTQAAFCAAFGTSIASLLTATNRTRGVADALAATVARESAAARAHDKQALVRQQANARTLLPQLLSAFHAESAAGAAAAALLRAHGVSVLMSSALVGRAQAVVERRLAARGITSAKLAAALGAAATPRATTLAASLASR